MEKPEYAESDRAAYVLFRFERSLGRYTIESGVAAEDLPNVMIEQIRRSDRLDLGPAPSLEDIVAATYLAQLFDLAAATCQTDDSQEWLKSLKSWCEFTGVFEIRSALAHPNRPWRRHNWFIVQALATHPAVVGLGLSEVAEAHAAALEGKFEPPPNAWVRAVADVEIPNNLDDARRIGGHGAFVGRREDRSRIRKLLLAERVHAVSLVAAGGFGKTALALQCLQDLSRSSQAIDHLDRIIFVSAKESRLTSTGLLPLVPDFTTAAELSEALSRELLNDPEASLEEAKKVLGDSRLLLCIDNLEGLILQDPQLVDGLLIDLPVAWKVLITSRVPVNSTNAVNLDPMNEADANQLATAYARERGLLETTSLSVLQKISEVAESPLAIRLALDGMVDGKRLNESLQYTKILTADFAYECLAENLSPPACYIVEALLCAGGSQPEGTITRLTKSDSMNTRTALHELRRANLMVADQDPPTLRESFMGFVERHPLDLNARNSAHAVWQELQGALQVISKSESGPLGDVEIDVLRVDLHRIRNEMDRSRALDSELLGELQTLESSYPRETAVLRVQGRLHKSRGNDAGHQTALEKAVTRNSTDWRAVILLSEIYRTNGRYEDVRRIIQPVMSESVQEGVPFSDRCKLVTYAFTCRVWRASDQLRAGEEASPLRELESVIQETADWEERGDLRPTYAGLHCMALRRSIEPTTISNKEKLSALNHVLATYRKVFELDGVLGFMQPELIDTLDEYSRLVSRDTTSEQFEPLSSFLKEFANDLLSSTAKVQERKSRILSRLHDSRKLDYAIPGSLRGEKPEHVEIPEALARHGYVDVTIHAAAGGRSFLFASDDVNGQYFIPISAVAPDTRMDFDSWLVGKSLWILPSAEIDDRPSTRAIDVQPAE